MTTVNTLLKIIKDGKVEYEQEAKSWLRNFYLFLRSFLTTEFLPMVNIDGATKSIGVHGGAVRERIRICLGTDNTPPTFTDNKLRNEVFSSVVTYDYVPIENGIKIRLYVQYTPSTAIDIWEIGLRQFLLATDGSTSYFLMLRDVFSQASHHEANEAKIYMIEVSIVA